MPTLLQINSVVNTGSTGRIAEQLGQLAMKYGWESYIAYGRKALESRSHLIRIGGKWGIRLHAVASMLTDRHGLFSKSATKRFLKQIDEIKPDIVHIHNIHGYYIHVPTLLKYLRDKNIATVITMHDFWLMTGHCAYINSGCAKWKNGCERCPRLNQYPAAKWDNSVGNWKWKATLFSDMPNITLVPVSYWLESFTKHSLLKHLHSHVIYNGIDTSLFKPFDGESTISGIDWDKFTILCIATRWTEANGMNDVLKLSSHLPSDAQIVMVGLDKRQMVNLPKNIIGLQKTENFNQLKELYTKSDVMFNPNREVTFGLVTAEAMACGTPAIVLRDTAGEELVDSETGYVVNCVEEVDQLIEDIKNRNTTICPQKCRERILTHFNADVQYKKYIDLYKALIDKQLMYR